MIYKTFTTQMNNFIISLLRDHFNVPVEIGAIICEYRSADFKDTIKKLDADDDNSFILWKIHYMIECAAIPRLRDLPDIGDIDEKEEVYNSDVGKLWRLTLTGNKRDRSKILRFIHDHLDGDSNRYASISYTHHSLHFNFNLL